MMDSDFKKRLTKINQSMLTKEAKSIPDEELNTTLHKETDSDIKEEIDATFPIHEKSTYDEEIINELPKQEENTSNKKIFDVLLTHVKGIFNVGFLKKKPFLFTMLLFLIISGLLISVFRPFSKNTQSVKANITEASPRSLWAWGNNGSGQLGSDVNNLQPQYNPIKVGTDTSWEAVSAGESGYSLGLKADGTLWSWGSISLLNYKGISSYKPIQIGTDTNWKSVSAGFYHCLALKSDGTLWAWGNNDNGQLGDGTKTNRETLTQVGTDSNWTYVSAGGSHTLALKSDGTLWAWGNNDYGELGDGTNNYQRTPIQIGKDTNWVSVSAGNLHSVALKSDGTLWAWGRKSYNGSNSKVNTPTKISKDKDWTSISAGNSHSLALKSDGTLWAWGYNEYGQLGDGTNTKRETPKRIGADCNWKSISAGVNTSLAIKSDGTLWSWGSHLDGSTDNYISNPTKIGTDTNWLCVSAGWHHNLAIKSESFAITTQPTDIYVNVGEKALLSVQSTYRKNLSYQWYSNTTNNTINGNKIDGATSDTYLAPTSAPGTTYYYCIVTGSTTETATSTAAIVQVSSEIISSSLNTDYILPESNKVKLKESQVNNLEIWQLALARNEIIARHGYAFSDFYYNAYFSSKKWYKKNDTSVSSTNSIEEENIKLLKQIEDNKKATLSTGNSVPNVNEALRILLKVTGEKVAHPEEMPNDKTTQIYDEDFYVFRMTLFHDYEGDAGYAVSKGSGKVYQIYSTGDILLFKS